MVVIDMVAISNEIMQIKVHLKDGGEIYFLLISALNKQKLI